MYEPYRDKAAFEEHGRPSTSRSSAPGELFPLMEERGREFYETLD